MPDRAPKRPSRLSLRHLALAAGVSTMTVSRVLRNRPNVKPLLRKRVLKAAADAGYRPDPVLSKLMHHLRRRTKDSYLSAIAAVTDIPEEIEPHTAKLVRAGARRQAEQLGYRLEVFRLKSTTTPDRNFERILLSRGIEGILLQQMTVPSKVDRLVKWPHFAVVAATASLLSPDFVRVGPNYFFNARLLCAELAARGCRRLGYVGSKTFSIRTNDAFLSAALLLAQARRQRPVPPLIFTDQAAFEREFRPWLVREKPDALIVHDENFVPIIRARLASLSRRPPLIASTSVNPLNLTCPGIDEQLELVGRNAVNVLAGMLNRNEKNLRAVNATTLVEGRWVEPVT